MMDMSELVLRPDCENCFALCCVALPYASSADFAFDKDGSSPCLHLEGNFRCRIHANLRLSGFKGCTVYECFGAGQRVSQAMYEGKDWREDEDRAGEMFAVFPIVQQLHEMLYYLKEASSRSDSQTLSTRLDHACAETMELTKLPIKEILELDVASHRTKVSELLKETSERVRKAVKRKGKAPRTLMMLGGKMKGANLRAQNLRGALMIAADLRGADLSYSELLGADLRDTDLRGADLTGVLFLSQTQVNAAIGDNDTKLPEGLVRPGHWEVDNVSLNKIK